MIVETTIETPVGALRLLASDEALRAVIWPRVDREREMAGEPIELHEVMIRAEQAGVATDLLLEIRNKLVTAYNEVLRMPM